jgi:Type II secretion system protein B
VSFIYEALKRAEDDNQQRVTGPVRAEPSSPVVRAPSRWWAWALIGVLGANALVIGAWTLVRGQRPTDAGSASARVAVSTPNIVASTSRPPSVETPKPEPAIDPAPEPAASSASASPAVARPARPEVASPTPPASMPSAPTAVAAGEPRAPRAAVATPSGSRAPAAPERVADRAQAPPSSAPVDAPAAITLQVLVYSETPAQRMVFIGGRRYIEGDAIDSETILERINADGAVFRRRGQRFVVSDRR